jgi:hypothetical protein
VGTPGEIAVSWKPRGVCDTILGDAAQPGAMASLQNLIHDPGTPNAFVCRPANTKEIDFTAWSAAVPVGTATDVVVAAQVGNIIYGLISITTGTFAGLDYPFAYDTTGAVFLAIAAVIVADCPTSQSTAGAWVPPQMTLTGIDFVVTHVGFPGGVGAYFGWFDVTTPLAPTWNVGNTATNALPSVPQACGTFNNRTRFACGNTVYYTDTLALAMTAATQSQTVGDYTAVTTLAPLPVSSSSNNIIQGLLAFKLNTISLITGDPATPGGSNLGLNQISASVGTAAPRSVVSTLDGVKFMADDGIRTINFFGFLSEPDEDLAVPFINAVIPSRVAAAFNSDVYRICTQNGGVIGQPYEDYWYVFKRKGWSGPHNFRYSLAVPLSNDFVLYSPAIPKTMWNSYTVQGHAGTGNTFIENGIRLAFTYQTPPMTELGNIYANSLLHSTIELAAAGGGQTYSFIAQNEDATALASGTIVFSNNQTVWGAFVWGTINWGASQSGLKPINIPWDQAAVFNRLSVKVTGPSSLGIKLGSLHNGYKKLKYLLN